tara:strand:+ start:5799 stop:8135 length:2337 start_codon:yes stop_codon:yes gene_type:complete
MSTYHFKSHEEIEIGLNYLKDKFLNRQKDVINVGSDEKINEFVNILDKLEELLSELNEGIIQRENPTDVEIKYCQKSITKDIRSNFNYWKQLYEEPLENEREARIINWGEWRDEELEVLPYGYDDGAHNKTLKHYNLPNTITTYKKIPPPLILKLLEIRQPTGDKNNNDFVFYTTQAAAHEIASASTVPSLPKIITPLDGSQRVLNPQQNSDEWQRQINSSRTRSITNFAMETNNFLANAPMLYVNDDKSINIYEEDGNWWLKVDYSQFLVKIENETKDGSRFINHDIPDYENQNTVIRHGASNLGKDKRPFWIIDGQHRIEGLAQAYQNNGKLKKPVPLIIIPHKQLHQVNSKQSLPQIAKLFTEINTLQVALDPLHEIFLMHRFKIEHPLKQKRNFKNWKKGSYSSDLDMARANCLAYELAAKLNSHQTPLKDLILFLKSTDSTGKFISNKYKTIIDAEQWLNYTRGWFLNNGPYSKNSQFCNNYKKNETDLFDEVNNFFHAFVENCNHATFIYGKKNTMWPDNKERWQTVETIKGSRVFPNFKNSLIQQGPHFQIFLKLYPIIYNECWDKYGSQIIKNKNIISKPIFLKVLKPLEQVDWIDFDLLNSFKGGGEKPRQSLYIWMEDAIVNGKSYSRNDVMAKNIKSVPGKGILSPPDSSKWQIIQHPNSRKPMLNFITKKGDKVYIESIRPWNAKRTCSLEILNINSKNKDNITLSLSKKNWSANKKYSKNNQEKAIIEIKWHKYISANKIKKGDLEVSVSWENIADPPGKFLSKL